MTDIPAGAVLVACLTIEVPARHLQMPSKLVTLKVHDSVSPTEVTGRLRRLSSDGILNFNTVEAFEWLEAG